MQQLYVHSIFGCRLLALCVVCVLTATAIIAQPSYTFTNYVSKAQPYTDITNDTVVPGFDQAVYDLTALNGETFYFYGKACTLGVDAKIGLGEGGFLALTLPDGIGFMDGILMELEPIDETSRVSYAISGTPGDYVLQYQYKHHKIQSGPEGNYVNMQMWVFQRTGVIEVRYGPRSGNNLDPFTTADGVNAGVIRLSEAFSVVEKLWLTGNPNDPTIDSAATQDIPTLVGIPDDGTIFRFTPRAVTSGVEDITVVQPPQQGESYTIFNVQGIECREPLVPGYYIMHIVDALGKGRTRGFIQN